MNKSCINISLHNSRFKEIKEININITHVDGKFGTLIVHFITIDDKSIFTYNLNYISYSYCNPQSINK